MGFISKAPQFGAQHKPPLGRLLRNRLPGNGRGNCHDNAVAESFSNLLKRERIRRRAYKTREDARRDVFDCIEMLYNPKRKHARNRMLSLVEFEKQQKWKQETRGYSASLIETCNLNAVEPHADISIILTAIINGHKQRDIDAQPPRNF